MGEEPKNKLNKDTSFEEGFEMELSDETFESKTHQRKEIRFSVRNRDDCWVMIEHKKYFLSDLSYSGLGISAQAEIAFQIGQSLGDLLYDCTLNVMRTNITGLTYKMIHISPDTGDRMICGMSWMNPENETRQLLASVIQYLESEALPDNNFENK